MNEPDLISSNVLRQQQQSSDLLRQLLDFDDVIESFEHLLRNERFDSNLQTWVSKGKPFLNEEGINSVVTLILTHLNKVFIMTNFNENDIYRMCEELGHNVIDWLYLNYNSWNIKPEDLSIIVTTTDHFVFAMLRASQDSGIREMLKQIEKRETVIREEPEKRKTWIPFIGKGD